jgi:uncharacterized protein YjiK
MCGNQPNTAKNTMTDTSSKALPYDLSNPSATFNLDALLHEISGLTATSKNGQLACLQDESGQLFYIDAKTGKATPSVVFQNSGDFEGIEFVKDTLWATTSKGKLFKVWNLNKTPFDVQIIKNESLKTANIEGLGYDKLNHRLLLASKADKADGTQLRTIWAFDLQKQTPSPNNRDASTVKKAFDIQLTDFQTFLKDKTEKKYAKLVKDYVENPLTTGFDFGPSGIAVHPLNGHIYIVSSINKILVVLSPEGKILEMTKLDKALFQQPEGLCFDAEGTLYISNEAKDNPTASLLVFKMTK